MFNILSLYIREYINPVHFTVSLYQDKVWQKIARFGRVLLSYYGEDLF